MSVFSFEIPNWDKWQERADRANFAWFKFHTDFFIDPLIVELSDHGKLLFVYCLTLKNRSKDTRIVLNVRIAVGLLNWTPERLSAAFNEIADMRLILRHKPAKRGKPQESAPREEKIREEKRRGDARGTAPPLHPLAEIWNQNRGTLAGVQACKHQRLKHAEARWSENPDPAHWLAVIERIKGSAFCTGKNDRGWKSDFDWLIKPETATKVLEGKYDTKPDQTPPAPPSGPQSNVVDTSWFDDAEATPGRPAIAADILKSIKGAS